MRVPRRPHRAGRAGRSARPVLRTLLTGLFLVLFPVLGLATGTTAASAHAVLERTDPPDDAVLARAPGQVSLTFGEAVQLPPHAIRVYAPNGVEIDSGSPFHPGGAAATVAVALRPGAEPGSYTVAWRVISADTHPVSGAYVFSVGHPSAPAAPLAPAGGSVTVGVLYAIVRAVAFGAFALLIGASVLVSVSWPAGPVPASAVIVARIGWATSLLATVATLLLQGPYGNGTGLGDLFDPGAVATTLELPLGSALVARLLYLAAYAVYLSYLFHRRASAGPAGRRALIAVGLFLATALAATWSIAGHAAVGPQPWLALPADVAHLTAMAIWLGGVATLALEVRRTRLGTASTHPSTDHDAHALGLALRRFSTLAGACVIVVVGTGTYQAYRQLGSLAALVDTTYGRLLDLKIVAVAAILLGAAASRRAVRRARDHRVGESVPITTLRRSLLGEIIAAGIVLALTAMLVNSEPGRTAIAHPPPAAGPVRSTVSYDTGGVSGRGSLEIELDPARPGPNRLSVVVRGDNTAPRDVPELDATLSLPAQHIGPLRIPIVHNGPGHYAANASIPLPGSWQLALTVRTSDFDETTVRVPVEAP